MNEEPKDKLTAYLTSQMDEEDAKNFVAWTDHVSDCKQCKSHPASVGTSLAMQDISVGFDGMKKLIHEWVDTMCVDGAVLGTKIFKFYLEEK